MLCQINSLEEIKKFLDDQSFTAEQLKDSCRGFHNVDPKREMPIKALTRYETQLLSYAEVLKNRRTKTVREADAAPHVSFKTELEEIRNEMIKADTLLLESILEGLSETHSWVKISFYLRYGNIIVVSLKAIPADVLQSLNEVVLS